MDDETLTVSYTLTPKTLYRAQMAIWRCQRWWRVGGPVAVVALPLAIVGWSLLSGHDVISAILTNLAWIVFFPMFWLVGLPLSQRWTSGRIFRGSPGLQGPRVFSFGPSGLTIDAGVSRGEAQWEAVIRVDETREFFLLYLSKLVAHVLPKEAFDSPSEVERFRQIVSRAVGRRARWAGTIGAQAT